MNRILAPILIVAFAAVGCGTVPKVDAEQSERIVRLADELGAGIRAVSSGLAAVEAELAASGSSTADTVARLREAIASPAEIGQAVAAEVRNSPLVDNDGNPREASADELLLWLLGVLVTGGTGGGLFAAYRSKVKRAGRMDPAVFEEAFGVGPVARAAPASSSSRPTSPPGAVTET